jgi:hypothetical protein
MANIKDEDLISVRNRNNGETWYQLDNGIVRIFSKGEIKKVPFKELVQLNYSQGGNALLTQDLVIEDKEALNLLNMKVEPEYYYDEADIRLLLFNGTYDEFADFLDFAPEGAIEVAKDIAVKEEIPDVKKREMLSKKTGLNINNAIMVNHIIDGEEETEKEVKKERRVKTSAVETKTEPARRAVAPVIPNHKVVVKK